MQRTEHIIARALCLAALLWTAPPLRAQDASGAATGPAFMIADGSAPSLRASLVARGPLLTPTYTSVRSLPIHGPDIAFLASLALPGAGQYVLHQQRWLPYAAVETWAWVRYFDRRTTARNLSRRYRDFAWDVARRVSTGARRDTTFPYYEILIHTASSGAFDVRPSQPGIQPEFDLSTYNGQQWDLARRLFVPEGAVGDAGAPGYEAALAYYAMRAIPDQYAFAWDTGRLEQQVYSNMISESDGAYRDATRLLGLILANHLTSAVDALISARLRSGGANLRFESGLSPEIHASLNRTPLRFDAQLHYVW